MWGQEMHTDVDIDFIFNSELIKQASQHGPEGII